MEDDKYKNNILLGNNSHDQIDLPRKYKDENCNGGNNVNQNKHHRKRSRDEDEDEDESDDDNDEDTDDSDADYVELIKALGNHVDIENYTKLLQLTTARAYGYRYDKYISGKRHLDMILGVWHGVILLSSTTIAILALLVRFWFGRYLILYVDNLKAQETYKAFTNDPTVPGTDFFFDNHMNDLCDFAVAVNFLYSASTVGYLSFYKHKSPVTMPATCFLTSLLVLIEITYSSVLGDVMGYAEQNEDVVKALQDKLHTHYRIRGADSFSTAYDYMSIWLKCCGFVSVLDFNNITLPFYEEKNIQIAPVCCEREVYERGVSDVLKCTKDMKHEHIYDNGCMKEYTDWVMQLCIYYDHFVWMHVLDCLIHAVLYKKRIKLIYTVLLNTYTDT